MQGIIRSVVRGAYDIQKLRIQMGLRIVANFKSKLGIVPSQSEDEAEEDVQNILKDLRASYKLLTDGVKNFPSPKTFKGDKLISDYTELSLLAQYMELEKSEKSHFSRLENVLQEVPIFQKFLNDIPGIGPAMAGVIISEIDIARAKYPSSLWKYAGLAVEADGKGTSKRTEHLKDIKYIDKDGKEAVRKGIEYNPFLKTKLMGVLSGSFLRAGDNKYSKIYRDYKNRLENHPNWKEKSKGHRHNASLRYMIKRFLVDLHITWRGIEGLEVTTEYSVGKLGMKHTGE